VRFAYIVSIFQGANPHNDFAPKAAPFPDGNFSPAHFGDRAKLLQVRFPGAFGLALRRGLPGLLGRNLMPCSITAAVPFPRKTPSCGRSGCSALETADVQVPCPENQACCPRRVFCRFGAPCSAQPSIAVCRYKLGTDGAAALAAKAGFILRPVPLKPLAQGWPGYSAPG